VVVCKGYFVYKTIGYNPTFALIPMDGVSKLWTQLDRFLCGFYNSRLW